MQEAARLARNAQRLATLYPTFAARLKRVVKRLEGLGLRPRIQDAWRSEEDQKKAYDAGKSELLYGFHNVTGPGGRMEALAVDLVDDNAPLKPSKSYILKLAWAAEGEGLITGIRWDVPANLVKGIDAAIAAQDWKANVKIGWDPLHVEPTGITVKQAKAGQRPG